MNQKENRLAVRQAAEKAVIRDEQNRRIQYAATQPVKQVLQELHATLCGLDEESVAQSRSTYGSNKVTHEKKKPLARRLADAFINPFTAILFCLALVSTMTDMVFPLLFPFRQHAGGFRLPDGGHHPDHGIHFRHAALCAGIPQRQRGRKTAGHDHHHLHRDPQRPGKGGDPHG